MSEATFAVTDGPPRAATVVVVPPLGMPAALMTPFVQHLARALRVVTVELPGAGHADGVGPTSTRAQAALLADVMRTSCPVPSHVFGISYGGMVATWLAIDAPELVDRLVLASAPARGRDAILSEPGEKLALLRRALGRGPTRVALAEAVASDETRAQPAELARIEEVIEDAPRSDTELVWLAAAVAAHDTTDALSGVKAPTLVLSGEADELVPAASVDALAAGIPRAARATIPGAGHAITLDRPAETARSVLAFLSR